MAAHSVGFLLLLLSTSMSISTLVAEEANDKAALLAFKDVATSGGGYGDALASWNSTTGSFCRWQGVTCGARNQRQRVVSLSLPSRGLTGVLSPAIGNLSYLRVLNLTSNQLGGEIPASIGRLRYIGALYLSHNAFSGELPKNLSSCASLTVMVLNSNQFGGQIPSELGDKLAFLRVLLLWGNNLTGPIPVSLANLSAMAVLDLSFNQLEGTIPPGLCSILGLRTFNLAFNSISGKPPRSMYNSSSLKALEIQGNKLRGGVPVDIGSRLPNIWFLSIGANQFTGTIPSSVSNLTALQVLDLSQNRFSGYVPHQLGRIQALQNLSVYDNMLQADNREGWGFIDSLSNCSQLQNLNMHSNAAFIGQLPRSIVNLSTTLQFLGLDGTGISGSIPSAISNLVSLEFLGLSDTYISGVIPESIGKLGNLGQIGLFDTDLSGPIPSSIGNLSKLTEIYASNAKLEGVIPASIGKMTNLFLIDLSSNHLSGSIPTEMFKLAALSFLNLSYNALSGPLPSQVGNLGNLENLALSGNQLSYELPDSIGGCIVLQELWLDNNTFEGRIPNSLNNLKGLTVLNLSMNRLSGTIPDAIGSIQSLQQLSLAHNNLSGLIPTVLQNMSSLLELDLSSNNLQGEVPTEGIFRNLANLSITGNNELCGGIPQLHLAPCHTDSMKKGRKEWLTSLIIAMATISSLATIISVILLLHKKLRRKQSSPLFVSPIVEQYGRVSYHAIANGTNGFSKANLLGKGSFGTVYKCIFQDEGTITAVKVYNHEQSGSTRSFEAECEALSRVRHRCLVKIITCCSSINHQGQEFKALVFEFMPNGSLNDWLHPKSDQPTLRNTLSLQRRLDISVDILDALDYLHNHCQPPIIHCDLKPSNILLAEDMNARVGDFGISRILPECASKSLQNSNSITGLRGSIGYVAPEYGEGSAASTTGDVYSLGILLLEMFTGRSPTDDMFGYTMDLHTYVENALSERILDVIDSTIWLHVESTDSIIRSRIKGCLVSVFRLAISCSKQHPRDRTMVGDAVVEMHAIRDSYHLFSS